MIFQEQSGFFYNGNVIIDQEDLKRYDKGMSLFSETSQR